MGGRPAKISTVISKNLTDEEKRIREEVENGFKTGKPPKPPQELSDAQKKIFRRTVKMLEASGILTELDRYVLARFAIALDRLNLIEQVIDRDPTMLYDKDIMSSKDKYTKDFFRCCSELCLSPQARAKMSVAAVNAGKEKSDPLTKALADLDD